MVTKRPNDADNFSLSPGERAGVRASVKTIFGLSHNLTLSSPKFSNAFTKSTMNRAAAPPSITR
jgi:hypothetical protein